jgi:hypothetical protein
MSPHCLASFTLYAAFRHLRFADLSDVLRFVLHLAEPLATSRVQQAQLLEAFNATERASQGRTRVTSRVSSMATKAEVLRVKRLSCMALLLTPQCHSALSSVVSFASVRLHLRHEDTSTDSFCVRFLTAAPVSALTRYTPLPLSLTTHCSHG